MAFFDDWSKKITETVDVVGKKAAELVEIQKLHGQILNLEKNMDKNYIALGKLLFEKYQNGEALCEEAVAHCEEIAGSAILIDEYRAEIAELKGMKSYSECGTADKNEEVYEEV